jgi:hypothetical protein
MFATIRRYTAASAVPGAAMDSFREILQTSFLPQIRDLEGFHSYYVIANDRELTSVSIFDTKAGCDESTRRAGVFVKSTPLPVALDKTEVIEGTVLVSQEGKLVGAH